MAVSVVGLVDKLSFTRASTKNLFDPMVPELMIEVPLIDPPKVLKGPAEVVAAPIALNEPSPAGFPIETDELVKFPVVVRAQYSASLLLTSGEVTLLVPPVEAEIAWTCTDTAPLPVVALTSLNGR